jgi:hypothetical protein
MLRIDEIAHRTAKMQAMNRSMKHDLTEPGLVARLLEKEAVERAYPLVHNLAPGVTLARWNEFARPQIAARAGERPHGLMTIRNPAGYILGLYGFEVRDELRENRTLCISNIIVPNVPGRDWIWDSMAESIDALAADYRCRAVRAEIGDELDPADSDRAWVVAALKTSGYALDAVGAFKRLGSPRGRPGA